MDFVFDPSLVLYLPLYEIDGSSLMSGDACGRLCTVTGALWRPNGRWFDATDDVITVPDHTAITDIFDGGGTFIAWINPASDGEEDGGCVARKEAGWLVAVHGEAGGYVNLTLYQFFSGNDGQWNFASAIIPINTFSQVAVTYDNGAVGNDPSLYFNGVSQTPDEARTPTETRGSDTGEDLLVGNRAAGDKAWDNLICEIMVYNRTLTPQEIQHNYLATKWRYR